MKKSILPVAASALLTVAVGCKQDIYNPLLSTPDPTITSLDVKPRGINNTQAPIFSVLIQTLDGLGNPLTNELSVGNFGVLQGDLPTLLTDYSPAPNEPFAVLLIMDRSGSMTSDFGGITRTDAANAAAITFLSNLPAGAQAGLIEFDSGIRISVGMTTNIPLVQDAIVGSTFGGGGTAVYDAIGQGALEISKVSGKRLIIVLTDGDDTGSTRYLPATCLGELLRVATVASGVLVGSDITDTSIMSGILVPTGGTLSTSLDTTDLLTDLNSTINGTQFQNLYKLTFRRLSTDTDITIKVNYGDNSDTATLVGGR